MTEPTLVLITRTRPAAETLVARVAELGYEPLECAPFQLEGPARPKEVAEDLAAALPADRVIMTSHEAVRQAVRLVGAESFRRSLVIVPGQGTASIARDEGIANVIFPERHGTSEAMLAMPELRDVEGLDVLILAASGGRGLMGETLERRGAAVERIHVYSRVSCALPDDIDRRIMDASSLVILGASWEAVYGLTSGVGKAARSKLFTGWLVAPSRRVADHAARLGFSRCRVATGAGDDAMLGALESL
ncbi:MAG: hypothetical protein GVY32_04340 [Gammaproteobacteria bacterium]|jgi:uroporphyrinogen-III synthase|nr:hypothetical protein [Gammaproteobacteria bacterium]